MTEIPEEIRKMFPDKPIHKLDIDERGDLHILASAELLSQEPGFENMPIEQVNQYLREHGYDPEQVKLNGKILTDALIENIKLTADLAAALKRAEAAEDRVAKLETALRDLRSDHHYDCEDCFYSCHKSGECCDERLANSECTCGMDQRNAIIDDALKGGEG